MCNEFSIEMRFVVAVLATWRVTHLLVAEDGPSHLVVRLRQRLGDSAPGRAMDCFYCSSVWVAMLLALLVTHHWLGWICSVLALSGGASLLEQATHRDLHLQRPDPPPPSERVEP